MLFSAMIIFVPPPLQCQEVWCSMKPLHTSSSFRLSLANLRQYGGNFQRFDYKLKI